MNMQEEATAPLHTPCWQRRTSRHGHDRSKHPRGHNDPGPIPTLRVATGDVGPAGLRLDLMRYAMRYALRRSGWDGRSTVVAQSDRSCRRCGRVPAQMWASPRHAGCSGGGDEQYISKPVSPALKSTSDAAIEFSRIALRSSCIATACCSIHTHLTHRIVTGRHDACVAADASCAAVPGGGNGV